MKMDDLGVPIYGNPHVDMESAGPYQDPYSLAPSVASSKFQLGHWCQVGIKAVQGYYLQECKERQTSGEAAHHHNLP